MIYFHGENWKTATNRPPGPKRSLSWVLTITEPRAGRLFEICL